jgi:formylglycine-generating enzyme required for sulfatase activity
MRSALCLTFVLALFVSACGDDVQSCETTADCKRGYECVQGRCLQPVNPCGSNLDCDFPLECVAGVCVEPDVEGGIILGCNKSIDDKCEADEKPHHIVTISPYEIDPTETTQSDFQTCIDDGGCTAPGTDADCAWDPANRGNHPVICVTWTQARDYCLWADKRLCTEAEWEAAARGDDGQLYPWGNEEPSCDLAIYGDCSDLPVEVGSLPAGKSPSGAFDMAGNVYEWVSDWYSPNYYTQAPRADPIGPNSGEMRVMRGGGYKVDSRFTRASNRGANPPDQYVITTEGITPTPLGFRCCRPL